MLNPKILQEKQIKSPFIIYAYFEGTFFLEIMETKMYINLILKNIKNMLFVVIFINWNVLMINLVSLLNHTQMKMLFTILLAV